MREFLTEVKDFLKGMKEFLVRNESVFKVFKGNERVFL